MKALDERHEENEKNTHGESSEHGEHGEVQLQEGKASTSLEQQVPSHVKAKHTSRPHVYELDPMRVVTALCVVAVHTLGFTLFLEHSGSAALVHGIVLSVLHFTRQIFMFFTAFALIYVYFGKPFSTKQFWIKRSIGVLLPYSIWSIIYTFVSDPHLNLTFAWNCIFNILTGSSSYQMYYILLSLQFYIVLPFFMPFMKRIQRHPWTALSISFLVQLVFLYCDFHFIQTGAFSKTALGTFINTYQDRFLLTYQFFFFLGAFGALYLKQAREFIEQHRRLIVGIFLLILAAFVGHYILQNTFYAENYAYALSVLQPSILVYSIGIILLFSMTANIWATGTDKEGHPRGYRALSVLSDASFGLYLIHALLLNHIVIPFISSQFGSTWPAALCIFTIWFLTAGASLLASLLLLQIPLVSRVVGRKHPREAELLARLRLTKATG